MANYATWAQQQPDYSTGQSFMDMGGYGLPGGKPLIGSGAMPMGSGQGDFGASPSLSDFNVPGASPVGIPGVGASGGFVNTQGDGGIFGGFGKLFGTKEAPGVGNLALGAAQGLFSGWLGMQQYGLAKQKLEESKRQYDLNYAAQRSTTNAQLEDRQRARVASNPGAYQSVGNYMSTYGIK